MRKNDGDIRVQKLDQARGILSEKGIDCWLIFVRETSSTPDPVLDLLLGTNCTWPSAFLLTPGGQAKAIVGSLDVQNIRDHAPYEVTGYKDSIAPDLIRFLTDLNPATIAVNYSQNDVMADGLTHGMYLMLAGYLQGTPFLERLVSSEAVISALRGRKTPEEVRRIRLAVDATLRIFDAVTDYVKTGMSEQDVADFIRREMRKKGLEAAWDPDQCPAVFTGPESAGAHAAPTERIIRPGHLMNIDFGVKKQDYAADLQRTWYFPDKGELFAPPDVEKGFRTIHESIRRAAAVLRPGVMGWTVDAAARQCIVDAGYAEYPHALGHQVGRKAHDGSGLLCPKWDRYKDLPYSVVEQDQVYTLEPRLHVEGHGIVTVEEMVWVKEDGCIFLSDPQESLIIRAGAHKTKGRSKLKVPRPKRRGTFVL
jgi:Xaa-Pro aminopeptidase